MYELLFSPSAERYFKKLKDKSLKDKFKSAIQQIGNNPYIGQPKRGDLSKVYGYDIYHAGINYEIAYAIFEIGSKKIVILLAGTRENFYEELKRLYN